MLYRVLLFLLSVGATSIPLIFAGTRSFTLKIIHFNDLHAKFDEITNQSRPCENGNTACVGGIARLATTIRNLKQKNPHHLVLNAGDVFQGTIWYTLLKWNVSQEFMNMIHAHAMTLGNHEFDDTIDGLIPYLEATKNVTPTAVSNFIFPKQGTKSLKNLKSLLNQKPMKLKIGNHTVGIIGVLYDGTDRISNTGPITFQNSIETVRIRAKQLKKSGVDKIVVLSHCGIPDDIKIAQQAGDDIDIIVGGHSHTLLYTGVAPTSHPVFGNYPLEVNSTNGRRVLIVQALCHGLYVGDINLNFDENGEISSYYGNPVYQRTDIEKDALVDKRVQELKKKIDEQSSVIVGPTDVELSDDCREKECTFGSAFTDAGVWYFNNKFPNNPVSSAVIHPGNFRTSIAKGDITVGQVLTALPFSSCPVRVTIAGSMLKAAFEHGVTLSRRCTFNMVQLSGFQVTVDFGKSSGNRTNVKIVSKDGGLEELDVTKKYTMVANSYLIQGGDEFEMFKNATVEKWAPMNAEVFQQYIKGTNGIKVNTLSKQRITVLNGEKAADEVKMCKAIGK